MWRHIHAKWYWQITKTMHTYHHTLTVQQRATSSGTKVRTIVTKVKVATQ